MLKISSTKLIPSHLHRKQTLLLLLYLPATLLLSPLILFPSLSLAPSNLESNFRCISSEIWLRDMLDIRTFRNHPSSNPKHFLNPSRITQRPPDKLPGNPFLLSCFQYRCNLQATMPKTLILFLPNNSNARTSRCKTYKTSMQNLRNLWERPEPNRDTVRIEIR